MLIQRIRRIFAGALFIGSVGVSVTLMGLGPATVNAQGTAPTLIPGVPVITVPPILPTLNPTQFPTNGTPEPPSGSPGGSPSPQPPSSPIQQIVRYFFQIFFPANTFREAIEGATRAIFEGTVDELHDPLTIVLDTAIFANGAVFGNVALPGELSAVADIMTRAAVPLWALSLALMALSVLTRQAVGMGYGSNEVAAEAVRWFFIALASGNGFVLVNFVHAGFGLLAREIAGLNSVSAGAMVDALLRGAIDTPIIILIIMVFIAIITIFVVIITYVARYAITLAIAALAPVAIACEGIPYLRFVCRDWLSMFLRVELLQIINLCVLVLFGHMMLFGGADGLVGSILRMVAMVGLASALIGINMTVFKQVFGVAIEAAQQMRVAVEQLIGGLAVVAGMALTSSPAPLMGMARPTDASPHAAPDTSLLTGNTGEDSTSASRVASYSGGAHSGSSPSAAKDAAGGEATGTSSTNRAAYRLGNAGASSGDSAAGQQTHHAQESAGKSDAGLDRSRTPSERDVPSDSTRNTGGVRHGDRGTDAQSTSGAHSVKAGSVETPAGVAQENPQTRSSGRGSHAQGDIRSTISQAGVVARTVSRGTRMGGLAGAALRGFGEGAGAGDLMKHQTPTDAAAISFGDSSTPTELMQARGERFARYTLGADSPDDARVIADQIVHPSAGVTPNQMRQAYEAVAPVARDMARQYGSPTRAAAQGGYSGYGEMANALATERLRAQGVADVESTAGSSGTSGPVEAWTSASPGRSQGLTPYDYGVGAMVSGHLGAQPATAPEWARTVQSLRQAYGDHTMSGAVLNRFVGQVESGQFSNEREAMQWLETQVQQQPPPNGQPVDLWWRGGSTPAYAASAGASHYDAGASQAERFARFTLGAETPGDVHAIAAQLLNAEGQQGNYAPDQMREAYETIAPLARDMSRQYGSSTRAAAIGGYENYGQLVTAMAEEHLRMSDVSPQDVTRQSPTTAGPIETWAATPPGQGTTSQTITPYDYGMGGFVAGQLNASAGARPEWARTMFSLRQAYGDHSMSETVFTDFIQRVGSKQFENERDARTWLEQQVEARAPTSGRSVHLWWKASAKAGDMPSVRNPRARKSQGGDA